RGRRRSRFPCTFTGAGSIDLAIVPGSRATRARSGPMTPTIVRARRADAAYLTRISRAAKRHWGYPESLLRLWRGDLTVTPGFIDRHPVYHAVHRGRVVGFYAISGTGRVRELEHMWVHPTHMGAGVGRALFAHLVQRLHAMGVRRLDVASDPNAEGFYHRIGAGGVATIAASPAGSRPPRLPSALRGSRRSAARQRPR